MMSYSQGAEVTKESDVMRYLGEIDVEIEGLGKLLSFFIRSVPMSPPQGSQLKTASNSQLVERLVSIKDKLATLRDSVQT